jgi:putative ABC transport system permease protein
MPPRYDFPDHTEVWIPPGVDRQITGSAFAPRTVARLAPGVTVRQAHEEVERIKYDGSAPDPRDREIVVTLLREQLVGSVRPLFALVAGAALLVLLVACVNTANLLLARVAAREREMSIRRALGASRARLVRFLLCESAVLAAMAGLLAVPIAVATVGALRALLPPTLTGIPYVAIDGRAMTMTAALSVLCVVLFGLAPALSVRERASASILREGASTPGRGWRLVRGALVSLQIAAGLILLAAAAAIASTVASLMRTDLGFRGESVVTFHLTAPISRYDSREKVAALCDRLEKRLQAVAGVAVAGVTTTMPGSREVGVGLRVEIEGLTGPAQETILFSRASADYFPAIGIDLRAGRGFTSADRAGTSPVAVVTESVSRSFGVTPSRLLGRRIRAGFDGKTYAEIVGVVGDHLMRGPEGRPGHHLYVPFAQSPGFGTLSVAVRTPGDPAAAIPVLRVAIREVDPDLPPYNIRTGDEIRAAFVSERRFARAVMMGFAILTAALSAIGLYGVVAYLVELRTREFGIRLALGATHSQIVRSALASGLTYALAGISAGGAAAVLLSRVVMSRIPGLEPVAPETLVLTAAAMLLLTGASAWLPARRAARVDPTHALRA